VFKELHYSTGKEEDDEDEADPLSRWHEKALLVIWMDSDNEKDNKTKRAEMAKRNFSQSEMAIDEQKEVQSPPTKKSKANPSERDGQNSA
jgi:hypothetical protein